MEEIFKDIPGYEGIYQVSNLGRVKSLSRVKLNKGKFPFLANERILKQVHLGYFNCELAAHLAYENKLKQII